MIPVPLSIPQLQQPHTPELLSRFHFSSLLPAPQPKPLLFTSQAKPQLLRSPPGRLLDTSNANSDLLHVTPPSHVPTLEIPRLLTPSKLLNLQALEHLHTQQPNIRPYTLPHIFTSPTPKGEHRTPNLATATPAFLPVPSHNISYFSRHLLTEPSASTQLPHKAALPALPNSPVSCISRQQIF